MKSSSRLRSAAFALVCLLGVGFAAQGHAITVIASKSLAAAITSCGSAATTIQVSKAITVSASLTVPSNCTLWFQSRGELLVPSGQTLTIYGHIQAPSTQRLFGGNGSVVFGPVTDSAPVEWFGAVPYKTIPLAVAGTDSTAAIQADLTALTAGHAKLATGYYKTTAALSITKSNVGIEGVSGGFSYPASSSVSEIVLDSASANGVTLRGTSGSPLLWNDFHGFSIQRSLLSGSGAAGFYVSDACGYSINHVQSEDSTFGFYFHNAGGCGIGAIRNSGVGWGYAGVVSGYSSSNTLYGWYFDSSDGAASASIFLDNIEASTNALSAPASYGFYIGGAAINDIEINNPQTAFIKYAVYAKYTGKGALDSEADIHINQPTFDTCYVSCVYVTGLSQSGGLPQVTVNNGYMDNNFGTNLVDIEDSIGVAITNNMLFAPMVTGATGILVHGSSSVQVLDNHFSSMDGSAYAIDLSGSTGVIVTGNTIEGSAVSGSPLLVGIEATNASSLNVITGNSIGNSSNYLTTGMLLDSTSQSNQVGLNSFGANVTTDRSAFTTQLTSFPAAISAMQYLGPAAAPTGSCPTNGAWVFSQDYHATVCEAGTWVTKM